MLVTLVPDSASMPMIAALLGYENVPRDIGRTDAQALAPVTDSEDARASLRSSEQLAGGPTPETSANDAPENQISVQSGVLPEDKRRPLPSHIQSLEDIPQNSDDKVPPAWVYTIPLPPSGTGSSLTRETLPLFKPNLLRALLTGATSSSVACGEVDLPALIESICRGTSCTAIPRRSIQGLGRRVHLLIDLGDGMKSFVSDVRSLLRDILRFVGRDRVDVYWFRGCPSFGVLDLETDEVIPYAPPGLDEPVLLITDFGHIGTRGRGANLANWLGFANRLKAQKSEITAVVPYAVNRIAPELRSRIRILSWDRETSVRDLRAKRARKLDGQKITASKYLEGKDILGELPEVLALAARASLTARAEPQLLRALRLEVAPALDVTAEAEIHSSRTRGDIEQRRDRIAARSD